MESFDIYLNSGRRRKSIHLASSLIKKVSILPPIGIPISSVVKKRSTFLALMIVDLLIFIK
jgi:hypothetical protein